MHKKLTITLDEAVYRGLHQAIGHRQISHFIENLVKPHVLDVNLDLAYRKMAEDEVREAEAQAWCNGVIGDLPRDEI